MSHANRARNSLAACSVAGHNGLRTTRATTCYFGALLARHSGYEVNTEGGMFGLALFGIQTLPSFGRSLSVYLSVCLSICLSIARQQVYSLCG